LVGDVILAKNVSSYFWIVLYNKSSSDRIETSGVTHGPLCCGTETVAVRGAMYFAHIKLSRLVEEAMVSRNVLYVGVTIQPYEGMKVPSRK
jgi:hypothetical protein